MINGKSWFAFFSHTGTEIVNICKRLDIAPDCIITTQKPSSKQINPELKKLASCIKYICNTPDANDYYNILNDCDGECICTLHGWMRIVPKSICKDFKMYNLHPGLISKYPELKGKDPQKRVDPERHTKIGVVIHTVTPVVDGGVIQAEAACHNVYSGEESITVRLHDMATSLWCDFFEKILMK